MNDDEFSIHIGFSERMIEAIVRFEMAMLDAELTLAAASDMPLLADDGIVTLYDWDADPDCRWLQ